MKKEELYRKLSKDLMQGMQDGGVTSDNVEEMLGLVTMNALVSISLVKKRDLNKMVQCFTEGLLNAEISNGKVISTPRKELRKQNFIVEMAEAIFEHARDNNLSEEIKEALDTISQGLIIDENEKRDSLAVLHAINILLGIHISVLIDDAQDQEILIEDCRREVASFVKVANRWKSQGEKKERRSAKGTNYENMANDLIVSSDLSTAGDSVAYTYNPIIIPDTDE